MLGSGDRLFADSSVKRPLRLVSTETIGEGLAFVTYEVVRGLSEGEGDSRARPGCGYLR